MQTPFYSPVRPSGLTISPNGISSNFGAATGESGLPHIEVLDQYLGEIGQIPRITAEEEIELAKVIEIGRAVSARIAGQAGDKGVQPSREELKQVAAGAAATEQYITANLRLVVNIAKTYQASKVPLLDRIQEGNIGLMHSVEKFDWRMGFRFSTYSVWWIRQAITAKIGDERIMPIPRAIYPSARRVNAKLFEGATYEEAMSDFAHDASLTERVGRAALALRVASLNTPVGEDTQELGDYVGDPTSAESYEALESNVAWTSLFEAVGQVVGKRSLKILIAYFGFDNGERKSHTEVGEIVGLSSTRVGILKNEALAAIRENPDLMQSFLSVTN